jgi:hypothetical protein
MKNKMFLGLLILPLVLLGAGCNVSTAKLNDVRTCAQMDKDDSMCLTDVAEFTNDTAQIIVTSKLDNAPADTEVSFLWKYLGGDKPIDIDSVTVKTKEGEMYPYSYLPKPQKGWPTGKYEVQVKIGTDNSQPVIKQFTIK